MKRFAYQLHKDSIRFFATGVDARLSFSTGNEAIDYVRELVEKKRYIEALQLIPEIEEKYPKSIKATTFYRGRASVALLDSKSMMEKIKNSK